MTLNNKRLGLKTVMGNNKFCSEKKSRFDELDSTSWPKCPNSTLLGHGDQSYELKLLFNLQILIAAFLHNFLSCFKTTTHTITFSSNAETVKLYTYWTGTSAGAANPCHKTFLRFRLEGGPIKMCRRLKTVSPNTSFSSCVANKSFSKDGHCDVQENERYTLPKACSREDVRSKRHKLWSAVFEDLRSKKQSKNLVSYPVHCKLALYLCSNSCCERLINSWWIAWDTGWSLLTASW